MPGDTVAHLAGVPIHRRYADAHKRHLAPACVSRKAPETLASAVYPVGVRLVFQVTAARASASELKLSSGAASTKVR